ncbi:MAG: helix-turn-helix domain-containing protein [Acidobacteria bacterium]|nr:helix-turn-helix domain-containing protein [Acidobacteriota bacterium]
MTSPGEHAAASSVQEAAVLGAADSVALRKAPAVRALLLYLWANREQPLNEYRIATECLRKDEGFDPKTDATVRVQISRLRQKLKEHGEQDAPRFRVILPQGSYLLQVEETSPASEPTVLQPPAEASTKRIAVWAIVAVLLASCIFLAIENRRMAHQIQATPPLPRFWAELLRNGKPTSVVLPTPVFFEWPDNGLKVRDTRINDFERFGESPMLRPLVGKFGEPRLMHNYTVVSDTFASVKLAQYLQARGATVSFIGTSDFSFDQFGNRNVILIGLSSTNLHIRQMMERTNFYAEPEAAATVHNRKPGPGESGEYKMVQQSGARRSVPGVVALLPGSAPNTKVLMLASWASSAMVSFLTIDSTLEQLDGEWRKQGSPVHFEALIQSEIEGNAVLRAGIAGLRASK